ncbi:hypothetical protein, partial [Xylanimonas ulmi]
MSGEGGFVLPHEASMSVDPPVGSLDDPPAWLDDEPADGLGTGDDLQFDPGRCRGGGWGLAGV